MAKRANPYVEDFVQQRKVHVGIKQFNNNEVRIQKVYEKTLELLFKGAKKAVTLPNILNTCDVASQKSDGKKQLCISNDGTLSHKLVIPTKTGQTATASCCNSATKETSCGYCEAALCSSCQHPCSRCLMMYCTRCSLMGSDGSEVCVSCYN